MPHSIQFPDGYGYVTAIALGAIPFLAWSHGLLVTRLRYNAKVRYPHAYATDQQMKSSKVAYTFNCAQRAHAQFMENMPQTIMSMLFAGLEHPRATALLGLAWMVFRLVYLAGYVLSSKPGGDGRLYGVPFWFVQGGIWALTLDYSRKLL